MTGSTPPWTSWHSGARAAAGKVGLLRALSSRLASLPLSDSEHENVPSIVGGAAMLGAVPVGPWAPGFHAGVQRCVSAFLADELKSKPIGFYTWTPELSSLFRQDRMLQRKLSRAPGPSAIQLHPAAAALPGHRRGLWGQAP